MTAFQLVSILLEDAQGPFDMKWDTNGYYVDVIVQGRPIGTLMLDDHHGRWVYQRVGFQIDPNLERMRFREPEQGARLLWQAWDRNNRSPELQAA